MEKEQGTSVVPTMGTQRGEIGFRPEDVLGVGTNFAGGSSLTTAEVRLSSRKEREAGEGGDQEDATVSVASKAMISSGTTTQEVYSPDESILRMEAMMLDEPLNQEIFEDTENEFPLKNGEHAVAGINESTWTIPTSSFLQTGAALSTQNDSSWMIDMVLDGDDGCVDDEADERRLLATAAKDEHDELLDSMLTDDDDFDEDGAPHRSKHDQHHDVLDSNLDDSLHIEESDVNAGDFAAVGSGEEYLVDESILKLEAILDDGLEKLGQGDVDQNTPNTQPDIVHHDSMARELDALLKGEFDEEVEIDFEAAADHKSSEKCEQAVTRESCPTTKSTSLGVGDTPESMESHRHPTKSSTARVDTEATNSKRAAGLVGRLFRSRDSRKQNVGSTYTTDKKNSFFSSSRPGNASLDAVSSKSGRREEQARQRTSQSSDVDAVSRRENTKSNKVSSIGSSTTRSFMSSTMSSDRKFGTKSGDAVEESARRALSGKGKDTRIKGSFMASTFTSNRKANETSIIETEKAEEKEREAKKIIVNLWPWRRKERPKPVLDTSIRSPPRLRDQSHIGFTDWTSQRKKKCNNTPYPIATATPVRSPQHSVLSHKSCGSLSSQCTITSFTSPRKLGIRGCQSKYDPYHHKFAGPCELCVFRLSKEEKEVLDLKGRHFMVQFTRGGCSNCQVFQKDFDEPPTRLCPKCYSISHREATRRSPGKGNLPGYTFAKVEFG